MTLHVWHVDLANKQLRVDGIRASVDVMRDGLEEQHIRTHVVGPQGDATVGELIAALRRRTDIDVVHLHSLFRPAQDALAAVARARGVPFVVSPHSALAVPGLDRRRRGKQVWMEVVGGCLLSQAAAVFCLSPQELRDVERLAPRSTPLVVPNAVPAQLLHEQPWEVGAAGSRSLVSLARWDVRQKGLDILAAIATALPADVRVSVHGEQDKNEPHRTAELQRGAPANFALLPPVFGDAKFRVLTSAAMYVAPSRWEGLSMSLLEALALGVPVAVSRYIADAIPVAEQGLGLVLDDDPVLAARQLARALDDGDALVRWSNAGRAWALRHCSPGAVKERLADAYSGIVVRAAGGARRSPETVDGTLRVLFTTARYLPSLGGTEIHTAEVAKRLAARGHHVSVVAADGAGQVTREVHEGVEVLRVPGWPRGRDYHVAPHVARLIASGSWDVVHCQGFHTAVAPLTMAAALARRLPLVVTFHSGGTSSRIRHAGRPLQFAALRPLLRRADRLVAVSPFEALHLSHRLQLPIERFSVVPSAGSLPEVYGDSSPGVGTIVASIGRLERYKGHHRAIAALPHLRKMVPDARLLLVGTGPYEGHLRYLARYHRVAQHVEFISVPAADRQQLASVLARTSLVVLLSEYESQGLAAYEAMMSGRPVLVSEAAALGYLASELGIRAVPSRAKPSDVADAMRKALREPPPRLPAPRNWDDVANAVESMYRELLGTPDEDPARR